jgi:hypothetical protein
MKVCFVTLNMLNPLRTEVYFCHQNQNVKNIGNFYDSIETP